MNLPADLSLATELDPSQILSPASHADSLEELDWWLGPCRGGLA